MGGLKSALRAMCVLILCVGVWAPGAAWSQDGSKGAVDPDEIGDIRWDLGDWELRMSGFLRAGLVWVLAEEAEGYDFVGQNNGFGLFNARFVFDGEYREKLRMRLQFDGAVNVREDSNETVSRQSVQLLDAFLQYTFHPAAIALIGQARTPTDVENQRSRSALGGFVRRSVVSDGVRPTEGIERLGNEGLGNDREIGVQLFSEVLDFGGVGLRYNVAVTNGNPAFLEGINDNNAFAYGARVELHVLNSILGIEGDGSAVQLGGFFNYNERTVGELPNLLTTEDMVFGGDLLVQISRADVMVVFIQRNRAFPDVEGADDQVTRGIMAQAGYTLPIRLLPLTFGYRFATLDPFVTDANNALVRDDQLTYHTMALSYRLPGSLLDVMFNYTITQEEGGNAISNDLIEVLVQLIY